VTLRNVVIQQREIAINYYQFFGIHEVLPVEHALKDPSTVDHFSENAGSDNMQEQFSFNSSRQS
jgi:hypothetical protein